ncbi:MAG TPA: hypothetical protein PLO53_04425 [Candidatus Hydrogenedentes bacterium]|nr:hypothetical protein [Candidatus Hydrogenedentota bacterium]
MNRARPDRDAPCLLKQADGSKLNCCDLATAFRIACLLVTVWALLSGSAGCGRSDAGRPKPADLGIADAKVQAFETAGRPGGPGVIVFAEETPDSWLPLLSRWTARGWSGIVLCRRGEGFNPDNASFWEGAAQAAIRRMEQLGAAAHNIAVLGEGSFGAFALSVAVRAPAVQAVVLASPLSAGKPWNPEEVISGIRDCPTLVITAENDLLSDTLAGRIKQAAPVFSEWRRYQGSSRGGHLLTSNLRAAQEMEDWLAAIFDAPMPPDAENSRNVDN